MTHHRTNRILAASLFMLAVLFLASNSFAALNAYLQLKGQKQGKIYTAKPDASGKFTFSNVDPDTYDLVFVYAVDKAGNTGSDARTATATGGAVDPTPATIEIPSFSWGATNSSGSMSGSMSQGKEAVQGKSTPVTRSNISNNRSFTVDAQGPTVDGVAVATGDLNGDGIPDVIAKSVSSPVSSPSPDGSESSKVVIHDITIMKACSPSGKMNPSGWDLATQKKM